MGIIIERSSNKQMLRKISTF